MRKKACDACTTDENFRDWVLEVIDHYEIALYKEYEHSRSLPGAVEAARGGDISPLRRLYPEIAEFLCPPAPKGLKKGETAASRLRKVDIATETAFFVYLVRRAWRKHCENKNVKHRKLSEDDTFEWFTSRNGASKRVAKAKYKNVTRSKGTQQIELMRKRFS
jgi:hypothetical protein